MSPYEIQTLVVSILGAIAFLGFLCFVVIGVIFLIKRIFMPDGIGAGEKKVEETMITKTLSKRENLTMARMSFYYIAFKDLSEFRVPKKIYKSTNPGDVVKITYEGQRLVSLSVVERSNESTTPKQTYSEHFTDNEK